MIEVGLEDAIREKALNYKIVENGINSSIGEKQLICIARELLRKSKVVLMDESTACIDYKTETLIQKSIEKVLKHSTIIKYYLFYFLTFIMILHSSFIS